MAHRVGSVDSGGKIIGRIFRPGRALDRLDGHRIAAASALHAMLE